MTVKEAFGHVLRKARGTTSQDEIAARSGYSVTFLSRLERGIQKPTIDTIFDLAKALGVSPTELIRRVEAYLAKNS